MLKKPKSTTFKFILGSEDLMKNLDNLKMEEFDRFIKIGEIGKVIQQLSKANEFEQLQKLCDKNIFNIPYMQMEINDAFVSAFNLRNEEVIRYYLQNGFDIESVIPDSVVSLCYSLQYLFSDPPVELLGLMQILVKQVQSMGLMLDMQKTRNPIRYGNLAFVKLMFAYGADVNAVNDNRKTPLGLAMGKKRTEVIQFLKENKGVEKWNE